MRSFRSCLAGLLPLAYAAFVVGCSAPATDSATSQALGETPVATTLRVGTVQAVGDRVFAELSPRYENPIVVELDPTTGKVHDIGLAPAGYTFSTDGQQFVFGGSYSIARKTLAAPTAPATKLADGAPYSTVLLHHDMAYYLDYTYAHNDDRVLYRVPSAGGTPQRVTDVDVASDVPPVAVGNSVFVLSESAPLNLGQIGDGQSRDASIVQIDVDSATPHIVHSTGVSHDLINSMMPRARNLAAFGDSVYVVSEDGLVGGPIEHIAVNHPGYSNAKVIIPTSECPNMEPTFAVDADGSCASCETITAERRASFVATIHRESMGACAHRT